MTGVRAIALRELLRVFLLRELGGRRGLLVLVGAVGAGALAAAIAARLLAPDAGAGSMPPYVSGIFLRFPSAALYMVGFAYALRAAGHAGADDVHGWTLQYFAAGATRDRYLVALVAAAAVAALAFYFSCAATWALVLSALRGSTEPLLETTRLLPAGAVWLAAAAAFAAPALALTGRASAAQGLMIAVILAPWLALLAIIRSLDQGIPAWLGYLHRLAPPYPVTPSLRSAAASLLFAGVALAIGYALSHRLLRVR